MKPDSFELEIIRVIKALRRSNKLKLTNLAFALSMSESNYCKIEKGCKAFSLGQLKILSEYLNTSIQKIILLAEFQSFSEFSSESKFELFIYNVSFLPIERLSITEELKAQVFAFR